MRLHKATLAVCLGLTTLIGFAPMALADEAKLEGKWRLVVLAFGEDEFLVLEAKESDGKLSGDIVAAQNFLGNSSVQRIEQDGDRLTAVFIAAEQASPFTGSLANEGAEPRPFLGSFRFRDSFYPARLEKTDADTVAPLNRGTLLQQLSAASAERDAKVRVEKLESLLTDNPGKPFLNGAYAAIFQAAPDAGLKSEEVEGFLKKMLDTAQPYGPEWTAQVRMTALRALSGKAAFADLTVQLAAEADRSLGPNASTEDQAALTKLYADAAKLAGKADLAASLEAKSIKLEAKLDSEYLEKVPPFKPVGYSGRENPADDRVVVLELFTGSQCPPCVAADVGFDALLKSYEPTELVAMQYHLHIPGPDPLTNPASLARAKYYGVRGTPSTFFSGESAAQGGGGMPQSQAKYDQYRHIIDKRLSGNKLASIDLKVTRTGDSIQIAASAKADPSELLKQTAEETEAPKTQTDNTTTKEQDKPEAKKQDEEPKLKLYLAVTEQSVRYAGGNKVRFHHHLVRTFVGGNDGKPLTDGGAEANVTIALDDIHKELNDYLEEYQQTGSFPNPLPPIELKGLSIVAFVQDDTSKRILHAVALPVPPRAA